MTVSNRDRWSQNPYAAMQPHVGALQRSGIKYVNGSPVGFSPAPGVGALPFPQIQIPAFPLQGFSPAQPSGNPSPQANPQVNPQPNPQPAPPSLDLLIAAEQFWVKEALAREVKAIDATIGGEPLFAEAADRWQKAGQAAAQIASMLVQSAPVASQNASARAYAYHFRQLKDEAVAKGTVQHPRVTGEVTGPMGSGWGWPPIEQQSEPAGPILNLPPTPPIDVNPPAPPTSSASSGTIVLLLALGAAAAYAAFKIFKVG